MPSTPANNESRTVKQQREAKRASKVALLKKQQAREKRNRLIAIIGASVAGLAVIALIVSFVVASSVPKANPDDITIKGLETFPGIPATHVDPTRVDYEADYDMNPPAGGAHFAGWLNCGVYTEPQENERAVHALEHGAIWVTYDPSEVTADEAAALADDLPSTYVLVTPYPDLPAPVVASAWGAQVQLTGTDDERLSGFVSKYRQNPDLPEAGAPCTGGIDGPGRVS